MTDRITHPCQGMGRSALQTFEEIAIGLPPRAGPKTILKLLESGLIMRGLDEFLGQDALGKIAVPTYFVPVPVHAQWCEWCDQNVKVSA